MWYAEEKDISMLWHSIGGCICITVCHTAITLLYLFLVCQVFSFLRLSIVFYFCNKIPTSFTCECNTSILCISVMTCKVSSLTTKSNEMLNNMIWTHYWNYSKYLLMNNLLFCNVNHNIYSLVYSIMAANTMSITEISGNVW